LPFSRIGNPYIWIEVHQCAVMPAPPPTCPRAKGVIKA
jgi:hypothetical protein